ncbi:hypothetical protein [Sinorhizobium americanum]|uniref:hypothetical protein n=1 Tax=Sinorhizobium americanum TaxID=194963 RepID=UPI001A9D7EAA|nr:hypothetical protein [Sinorhizobium americanum]
MALAYLAEIAVASAHCMTILAITTRGEGGTRLAGASTFVEAPQVTLDLGPLQLEDARALASGLLAMSGSFVERCVERAAGNSLFLKQLLTETQQRLGAVGVPGSAQRLGSTGSTAGTRRNCSRRSFDPYLTGRDGSTSRAISFGTVPRRLPAENRSTWLENSG